MKKLMSIGLLVVTGVLALQACADVISKGPNGFHLKSKVRVPATPDQAYQQFLKVDRWWIEDHTYFGSAENLSIEPRAGGCFCEIEGDREVLHMTVSFVDPGREIRLLGGLGPLQQMGIKGTLSFKFIPISDGETTIVQEYRVTGYDERGLEFLADIVDAVQTAQLKQLQESLTVAF